MNRKEIIICDLQWLRSNANNCHVKELAYVRADDLNIKQYMFLPPFPDNELHHTVRRSNDYCTKYIHKIAWEAGDLNYLYIKDILQSLGGYKKVLVHGQEKLRYLAQYLDNVELIEGVKSFFSLPSYKHSCPIHSPTFKRCARHHVVQLLFHLERNRYFNDDSN